MVSLSAGLALSGCAGAGAALSANRPTAGSGNGPAPGGAPQAATASTAPAPVAERELTPREKQTIIDAVAPSLKDPKSAKYHWVKFPADGGTGNYCATVDAKSPYPPYDGRQAFIVAVQTTGGQVDAATMDLIAGGKDAALVSKMCAKYGLDPNQRS